MMKNPKTPLLLALPLTMVGLGLTLTSSSAEARPRGARGPAPGVQANVPFRQVDTNRNGVVTRRELKRFHRIEARATALRLDRNDDGFVSPREFDRQRNRGFARADFNRDGRVNRAERQLARELRRWGVPRRAFRGLAEAETNRTLRLWDLNGDGRIVRAELPRGQRFDRRHDRRFSRNDRRPGYAYGYGRGHR